MPDYCVRCGDVEASTETGKYIEFENTDHSITIERFVCHGCLN